MILLLPTFLPKLPSRARSVLVLLKYVKMKKNKTLFQRTESYYTELMLGRQFTGDSFKVSGGGERRLGHSQIVGITNKKSCGEKRLSDGGTGAGSQRGFG